MKISWPKGMERWKAVLERYRYALLVVAVGALLLLLPTGGTQPAAEERQTDRETFFQLEELEELEEKLARTLSSIHGAGETEVMLTLKSGSRQGPGPGHSEPGGGGAQRLHRDPGAWLRQSGGGPAPDRGPPVPGGAGWCAPAGTTQECGSR